MHHDDHHHGHGDGHTPPPEPSDAAPADGQHAGDGQHPGHGHGHHSSEQVHTPHGAAPEAGGHGGHGTGGHGDHGGDHVAEFRRLFWVMLVLAVPVVVLSPMFASLLGYGLPDQPWVTWTPPVLGTVMYLWGGRPFLVGAVQELRNRRPAMMLLIGLAITVAFLASWGATLGLLHHELEFWWELALLLVIMLLGHWVEMRSLARTTSALDALAALIPDEAERLEDGRTVAVPPARLRVGDLVLVRPGGRVPADGRVTDGDAAMDESMITGESRPVRRGAGDRVVAGTVATDSGLRIEVTAVGDDTALAGIQRLVTEARQSTSRSQRLADRAAGWLFWFALGVAAVTAVVWSAVGNPDAAVMRTITVLVIACPHALGLAIPLVVSIATERAARGGVLVKDRLALESMRTVDTVLFDKTGTLTRGEPELSAVRAATEGPPAEDPATGWETADAVVERAVAGDPDAVLALAAAAEADSEHPLARAVRGAAAARGLAVPPAAGFASSPAVGVVATVAGRRISVGGPRLLAEHGREPLPETDDWRREGAITLHVLADGAVLGALRLADAVRVESREAVAALHALGHQVVMVTGDAEPVAREVARELGIDRFFAEVRPEDKSGTVATLQDEGRRVAMVGDGVNDAPALARADTGIAIGAGTDVAIASAGVILASDDPRSVLSVIELSRAAYRKMRQNLGWAAGYNAVAVPLAAGVLAPVGVVLPMAVGAVLMSLSTLVVAANAQLLRRLDLRPATSAAAARDRGAPTGGTDAHQPG